jgi:hypothetical protein
MFYSIILLITLLVFLFLLYKIYLEVLLKSKFYLNQDSRIVNFIKPLNSFAFLFKDGYENHDDSLHFFKYFSNFLILYLK